MTLDAQSPPSRNIWTSFIQKMILFGRDLVKGANSTVKKIQTETLSPSDMSLTDHDFERSSKEDVHMKHALLPGSVDKSSNMSSFTFANCQVTLHFNHDMTKLMNNALIRLWLCSKFGPHILLLLKYVMLF